MIVLLIIRNFKLPKLKLHNHCAARTPHTLNVIALYLYLLQIYTKIIANIDFDLCLNKVCELQELSRETYPSKY